MKKKIVAKILLVLIIIICIIIFIIMSYHCWGEFWLYSEVKEKKYLYVAIRWLLCAIAQPIIVVGVCYIYKCKR